MRHVILNETPRADGTTEIVFDVDGVRRGSLVVRTVIRHELTNEQLDEIIAEQVRKGQLSGREP